jgi:hypothetical protein
MNKFQNIVHRRIISLILDAKSAGEPQHNATAGFLREKYIVKFLEDMTPWGISLTSGVLFDAGDLVSPQLDLIVVNNSILPAIALHEQLSMVPIEAALLTAEIKSTLNSEGLNQLARHNKFFQQFKLVARPGNFLLPTIMVALDSSISKQYVIDWMQTKEDGELVNRNTAMCCVIGKFFLIRQGDNIQQTDGTEYYQQTLSFIADFWGGLMDLQRQRQAALQPSPGFPHPLEAYLKGMITNQNK